MKTMESRVNGRACAESARTDREIKAQGEECSPELRAVLKAVKSLGQSMDLKMETMEERRVADSGRFCDFIHTDHYRPDM